MGRLLFPEKAPIKILRSYYSENATQPVPGYPLLASNIMARVWNTVPGLTLFQMGSTPPRNRFFK